MRGLAAATGWMTGWRAWAVAVLLAIAVLAAIGVHYVQRQINYISQDPCADVSESRRAEVCKDRDEEWFKYGSLGSEVRLSIAGLLGTDSPGRGIPYPIFHALPRVFAELLPHPQFGGYRAFGIPWEEGRELPVGFSKRRMLGFDLVTQNCAICHTATYRTSDKPDAKTVLVPTGPAHTTSVMAFLDFMEKVSKDSRLSGDGLLYDMNQMFKLNWFQNQLYRRIVIPFARRELRRQVKEFAWIHAHNRPDWGPGRDAPFNLTKFFMLKAKDDGTVDNADFPSIWNMKPREGTSLNWAGETRDPLAVFIDSALGLGAPPGQVKGLMERMRDYLQQKQPPKFPFDIDDAKAERGQAVWNAQCADCHDPNRRGNGKFGKAVPIADIGTDRERFDTWSADDATKTNAVAKSMGVEREDMVKDIGYVSQPLDGIWLRAPYLHNGSVPTLRDLLKPANERPEKFWRGCDVYDARAMGFEHLGFESNGKSDYCPRVFLLDTKQRGNGNGGHRYGIDLSEADKDALVEYMKKL
jgi:mono/diheme cytochrome c family protein